MTFTYKKDQYIINTSLTENTIYLKIVNEVSYAIYEGTFDNTAFRLPFDLTAIHRLINNCFMGNGNNSVDIELDTNGMFHLRFHCILEKVFNVDFELKLREKIVSGDGKVSAELEKQKHQIEKLIQRLDMTEKTIDSQNKRIEELEKRTMQLYNENVEHKRIIDCIGGGCTVDFKYSNSNTFALYQIGSTALTIGSSLHNYLNPDQYEKIKFFYQLKQLTLSGDCNMYEHDNNGYGTKKWFISNESLTTLSIGSSYYVWSDMEIIKQFPNLEVFCVGYDGGYFEIDKVIEVLETTPHKLKKISTSGVRNAIGIQSYCDKHGIELEIR